jgi:hypothetical protein
VNDCVITPKYPALSPLGKILSVSVTLIAIMVPYENLPDLLPVDKAEGGEESLDYGSTIEEDAMFILLGLRAVWKTWMDYNVWEGLIVMPATGGTFRRIGLRRIEKDEVIWPNERDIVTLI